MKQPTNLLLIMSDEHNPKVAGYSGHPIIRTPNLDKLSAMGTTFTSTYTTSPVCIPARAGFATGKYIHQIGFWDNADAYDGTVKSWHHVLRGRGHRVDSIGKLHFHLPDEDHGFTEEQIPMHIIDGKGDLMGLVREDLPRRGGAKKLAAMAGPGESPYTFYDKDICSRAQVWLHERGTKGHDKQGHDKQGHGKPWVLFVSFVAPHFPLTAPPEHYYRYARQDLPLPKLYAREQRPVHPYLNDYRESFCYDDYFETEADVRRAIAGYFGLVSYLDENIGKIMNALDDSGLAGSTRVMYTSDHGDNLGSRGLWGKSTMYEEIAGVPMILAGPGIPAGLRVSEPVSHVDAYPTILESVGVPYAEERDTHRGVSLFDMADGLCPKRTVLSEYHGMGSTTGAFAIRHGKWKYIHYVKYQPQLFDLDRDPEEIHDLSSAAAHQGVLAECRAALYAVCDPEQVDARAKRRQAELLAFHGGREAVIARGDLGFTPAPGQRTDFQ